MADFVEKSVFDKDGKLQSETLNQEQGGKPIKSSFKREMQDDENLKSEKEKLADKCARAAIMARNMSHNLGSHVLSYAQHDIDDFVNRKEYDSKFLSYQRGIIHLLKYLQERQDFIATLATANVPYFLPLAFKETVFDFINPDYRANRHNSSKMVDNILLSHIARSESYVHETPGRENESNEKQVLVSLYDRKNNMIVRGKDPTDNLDFIRDNNYMFPAGVVGRHAIMSIVENLIRNAAKHEKVEGNLELVMELCTYDELVSDDNSGKNIVPISDENVRKLYKESSDKSFLDYLIFSYRVANPEKVDQVDRTIVSIQKGLREEYCDESQNILGSNKGIKEIRISAAWLRGEMDEDRYSRWWDKSDNAGKQAPLVYVQKQYLQDGDKKELYLQYIIGLRRAMSIAIVREGFDDSFIHTIKNLFDRDFDRDVIVFDTIDKYRNDCFSNCAEYTLVANDKIRAEIRPSSYERVIVINSNTIHCESKEMFLEFLAGKLVGDVDEDDKIWIEDNDIIVNDEGKQETALFISEISSMGKEEKHRYVPGMDFRDSYRFLYRRHFDQLSEWDSMISQMRKNNYTKLEFIESLTGANSTDRLVRHTNHDTLWYYRQLYAMKKQVAIIDERLYDMFAESKLWQKIIFLKLKGVYLYKIDENTGEIWGFSPLDDYTEKQSIAVGKIEFSNGTKIDLIKKYQHPADYISIHQGLLDKLYAKTVIQKREFTDLLYKSFTGKESAYVGEGFQEGLLIHSGRSKPEEANMPQKVPFIQYSSLYDALIDCKYTLVNLLSYAKYQL